MAKRLQTLVSLFSVVYPYDSLSELLIRKRITICLQAVILLILSEIVKKNLQNNGYVPTNYSRHTSSHRYKLLYKFELGMSV